MKKKEIKEKFKTIRTVLRQDYRSFCKKEMPVYEFATQLDIHGLALIELGKNIKESVEEANEEIEEIEETEEDV